MKLNLLSLLAAMLATTLCASAYANSTLPSQCVPLASCSHEAVFEAEQALNALKAGAAGQSRLEKALLDARSRYVKRIHWLAFMEPEQARIEADKVAMYGDAFDAKAHAEATAAQLAVVQTLTPTAVPNPQQVARTARIADLNRLMSEQQTQSAAAYQGAKANGLDEVARTALLAGMKADFKSVANELRALHAANKEAAAQLPGESVELIQAREQLMRLVRIGELPDRARLMESARKLLAEDEVVIAVLEKQRDVAGREASPNS